jgi:predicted MPP superfamily phosphohydrolase
MNNDESTLIAAAPAAPQPRAITRRQFLTGVGVAFAVPAAGLIDSTAVEPERIVVEDVPLALRDFPGPATVVQISDLHMHGPSRFMNRVRDLVNAMHADFIFVTGDLVEDYALLDPCLEWLASLRAAQPLVFVPGNWERLAGTWKRGLAWKLTQLGARVLCNEGLVVEWNNGAFFLAGIDDWRAGNPQYEAALGRQPRELCTVLLSHEPIVADALRLSRYRIDLLVAGHTHGGQVRLPFLGAVVLPYGSGRYEQGLYRRGDLQMYVNRGLGYSAVRVRFLCPPEITRFTLENR